MRKRRKARPERTEIATTPPASPGPEAAGAPGRIGLVAVAVACAALYLWSYSPAADAPFFFDDILLQADSGLHADHLTDVVRVLLRPREPRRVGMASFALDYYLGAREPAAYRRINMAIHAINGLLVYLLLVRLFDLPRFAAAIAAALWLLHPVQTQGVIYVCQRFASLVTLFYLASLLCFIEAVSSRVASRRARIAWATASAVLGLLALGTKQNAGTLPFFMALIWAVYLAPEGTLRLRKAWPYLVIGSVVLVGVLWVALGPRGIRPILEGAHSKGFSPWQRVMTEWRVVVYYVTLLAWPHPGRLMLDYDFALSQSLFDPPTTLGCLLLLLGALAWALLAVKRHPLASCAVLWFLGQLAIESSIFPLDLVYEHRLYLPSVVPAGAFVQWVVGRRPDARRFGLLLLLGIGLAAWTRERSHAWQDRISLYEDNVAKAPGKARVHGNLAEALLAAGRVPEARQHLTTALSLDPSYRGIRSSLAVVELQQGGNLSVARSLLEEELSLFPDYPIALTNLGLVYLRRGDLVAARGYLWRAAALAPADPGITHDLILVLLRLNEPERALRTARVALAKAPDEAGLMALEGATLFHLGRREEARVALARALARDPTEPTARAYQAHLAETAR